jgi:hypothetical protein
VLGALAASVSLSLALTPNPVETTQTVPKAVRQIYQSFTNLEKAWKAEEPLRPRLSSATSLIGGMVSPTGSLAWNVNLKKGETVLALVVGDDSVKRHKVEVVHIDSNETESMVEESPVHALGFEAPNDGKFGFRFRNDTANRGNAYLLVSFVTVTGGHPLTTKGMESLRELAEVVGTEALKDGDVMEIPLNTITFLGAYVGKGASRRLIDTPQFNKPIWAVFAGMEDAAAGLNLSVLDGGGTPIARDREGGDLAACVIDSAFPRAIVQVTNTTSQGRVAFIMMFRSK